MVPLNGYRTARLLRSSGQSRVYEAVREADGRAVVAKVFELDDDTIEARVEHEFALIEALDLEGVVKALSLERVGDQLILLLERVPGQNLAEYSDRKPLDLDRFFAIAGQLCNILERIHERRVIHRDIKPTNVLIEPDTGRVCLADFGISVLLDVERRYIYDPAVLEGTLPYISPEQTGRTGRGVDFRSDLYSLGVTLYELLTGHLPFEFDAPLELIHAHLARIPRPPSEVLPGLPRGLDRVILKLLEKAPERRYQTAAGLATDLRKLRELVELGLDGRGLALGRDDHPRHLHLPHQLYGRSQTQDELSEDLGAVIRSTRGRFVLLSGPSGIGKSALLDDFHRVVVGRGGHYAKGRFDRSNEQPYAGFIAAFEALVEQLLTESETRLDEWREVLGDALGNVAQVLIDLVPRLGLVLGEQRQALELQPLEARNRLHLVIARFLAAFAKPKQPLVLVLDDLHWADTSSIDLLRSLVGPSHGPMLILGSYREQALDPDHPLAVLIEELGRVHRVKLTRLTPLSKPAIAALLGDTLGRTAGELEALTEIVARKTGSNPLFVHQFLTQLGAEGVLRPSSAGWTWNQSAVEQAQVPDDVLGIMEARLAALDPERRELLARAACIGSRFELPALEIVSERPAAQLTASVYALVETGLLSATERSFSFAHDRIRDVALRELSDRDLRDLHTRLGHHALAAGPLPDERLFETVDHLDAGLCGPRERDTGPLDEGERIELAALNWRAGKRALVNAAYGVALRYLDTGIALCANEIDAVRTQGQVSERYALVVGLHISRAQALALDARHEQANAAFAKLFEWSLDLSTYARVAARRVRLLTLEDRHRAALELGLDVLERLGYRVSRTPNNVQMTVALVRAWLAIRRRPVDALLAIPECEDEQVSAVMELISAVKNIAYIVDPKQLMMLTGLHIKLFLNHGYDPSCAHALGHLALGVGPGMGRIEDAIELCDKGLALAERSPESNAKVLVESSCYLFIWHLGRPFAEPISRLDGAYERALEGGDFEFAGYMGALGLSMHFEIGTHLRVVERKSRRLERDLGRWGSIEMVLVARMIRAFAVTLSGHEGEFDHDAPDGDTSAVQSSEIREVLEPEAVARSGASRVSVFAAHINFALLRLTFGDPRAALDHAFEVIDEVEQVMLGSWMVPRAAMATALAVVRCAETERSVAPRAHAALRSSLRLLARWAKPAPDNFGCYSDLAHGANFGLRGRTERAMRLLERARARAHATGNWLVEGLASEQLAQVAAREGLEACAEGALRHAWAAFAAWGANAKLAHMRAVHPALFGLDSERASSSSASRSGSISRSRSASPSFEPAAARSSTNAKVLDFESLLEAVGEMSEDLELDEVVERVLRAAITNAGADRGVLVFERDGSLGLVGLATVKGDYEGFAKPRPLAESEALCAISLIHFVVRTRQELVLDDARTDPRFADDPYVVASGVRSLLAIPIVKGKRLLGALVLENRLSAYCFTPERLETLSLIAGQAASALDNANLFSALRRSEAQWRSLVDGAPDIIVLLDEHGEIVFANRDALRTPRAEASGEFEPIESSLSPSSAAAWREAVGLVLEAGVPRELEIESRRPNRPPQWYTVRLAPIETGTGIRRAIAIATNITERRIAECERELLEAQLRQQQRLESIGTLASGVAHEINNPVQGILNYAELITDNLDDHAIIREFADEITTESNRVANIVRNLLQFSRQERDHKTESADINAIVEATLSLIHAVLRKDMIHVEIEAGTDLPEVQCRIQQIQQIIMNLVTNARDALNEVYVDYDERKTITIRTMSVEYSSRSWIRVEIEDRGPGIPPDVLTRIFDPFYTTKGRDQGTGLGLSVSHGIAHDHGGELSVETELGVGTRFWLDLPV